MSTQTANIYACPTASLPIHGATTAAPRIQNTFSTAGANAGAANRPSPCSVAELTAARHTRIKYGNSTADNPASSSACESPHANQAQAPITDSPAAVTANNTPASQRLTKHRQITGRQRPLAE